MIQETSFKLIPRGIQGFAPLAERAEMRIANSVSNGFSEHVLLRPFEGEENDGLSRTMRRS
jgi:hypothetical protein